LTRNLLELISVLFFGKIMKNIYFVLALAVLSISRASACSCALTTLKEYVDGADQIFVATLQEAKVRPGDFPEKWPYIEGVFRIKKSVKGEVSAGDVTLSTGLGRGDCGVSMHVSAKYIIFKSKEYSAIGSCSGSSVIEDFQEDEVVAKIQTILRQRKHLSRKR
jgi:hypothetical protein